MSRKEKVKLEKQEPYISKRNNDLLLLRSAILILIFVAVFFLGSMIWSDRLVLVNKSTPLSNPDSIQPKDREKYSPYPALSKDTLEHILNEITLQGLTEKDKLVQYTLSLIDTSAIVYVLEDKLSLQISRDELFDYLMTNKDFGLIHVKNVHFDPFKNGKIIDFTLVVDR